MNNQRADVVIVRRLLAGVIISGVASGVMVRYLLHKVITIFRRVDSLRYVENIKSIGLISLRWKGFLLYANRR